MIDATGELLGLYRKSHIPDGPGYMEKYYFTPGDTGFKAFRTASGVVGAGICWDQWYPEAARAMALQGAEVLLYPTAIGSEPEAAGEMDTSRMWQRVMIGHAVANACYLGAANRVGTERIEGLEQSFYGCSFIADYTGEKIAEAGRTEETVLVAPLDLAAARSFRAGMGFFRDRRPDLYGPLMTSDGKTRR
jgi:N-carbamoylputrescine amidase